MSLSRTPTNQHDSENHSFLQIIVVSLIILFGIIIQLMMMRKKHAFKNTRDQEGFTQEDKLKQKEIWDRYSMARSMPFSRLTNHTKLFFSEIGKVRENQFKSSTNQILQLGISNGEYVTAIAKAQKNRKVIGYDYSTSALSQLKNIQNIETRLVNLDAVDANKNLYYQQILENDFSDVTDILLIRILEYLNPETAKLLIISMMQLAKPGSRFYLEISSPPVDKTDPSGIITMVYNLKPGIISSLFANRNDFELEVLDTSNAAHEDGNTLERLIIKKI